MRTLLTRHSSRKEFDEENAELFAKLANKTFGPDGWRRDMTEAQKDQAWEEQRNSHD
jgi:recombination DNA repair RAD52 pathway protein